MAVSGWGGANAFIEEGLRRAEEDKKRKAQEEERKRREEERRAQAILPTIDKWRTQGPRTLSESRPTESPILSNPYKVDTETPQIGSSPQMAGMSTLPGVDPLQSVNQPRPESTYAPNPRRNQDKALGIINQPPVGMIDLQLPRALPAVIPQISKAITDNAPKVVGAITDAANIIGQGAQDTDWSQVIPKTIGAIGGMLPGAMTAATAGAGIAGLLGELGIGPEAKERSTPYNEFASQQPLPETPAGAIVDRYLHNFIDDPKDASDQLLKDYVPAVNAALKIGELPSLLSDLGRVVPHSGALLGQPDKTIGEAYSTGIEAFNLYMQDYQNYSDQRDADGRPLVDLSLLTGVTVDGGYSPPDIASSLKLANTAWSEALTPTDEQKARSTPQQILAAQAQAIGMSWHGIPAMTQMFDDILDAPAQVTNLRDQASAKMQEAIHSGNPVEREKLLWEAASLGGQAKAIANTHPAELFSKNANWKMALPAEFIFDPMIIVDVGFKLAGLAPKARRFTKAAGIAGTTIEDAIAAVTTGKVKAPTLEEGILDWEHIGAATLGVFNQVASSKAVSGAKKNFAALMQMTQGFNTKEDLRTIVSNYVFNREEMLRFGIPADQLTTGWVKMMYPDSTMGPKLAPGADYVPWGPAIIGNYDAITAFPAIENVTQELIDAMPSLRGTGPVENLNQFVIDTYQMLTRSAGEEFGVAKLPGVPAGAKSASTQLTANGQAIVKYFADGRQAIMETAEMPIAQANNLVNHFRANIGQGEIALGPAQTGGNFLRSITSLFALNSSFKSLINNAISNRTLPAMDGVWSINGKAHNLEYLSNLFGGVIPDDIVAGAVAGFNAGGTQRSMFSETLSNIPGFKQLRDWRVADEERSKINVYATAVKQFVDGKGAAVVKPAIETWLRERGWSDPDLIKNAVESVWTVGNKGGAGAFVKSLYDIANGSQPTAVSTVSPDYTELFGAAATQLDNIIASVRPENLNQALIDLEALRVDAINNVATASNGYVFGPGRSTYTTLDTQKTLADYQSTMVGIANSLGQDYATGVAPHVNNMARQLNDANQSVLQLVQMAGADPGAAGHLYDLWERISHLRTNTQTALNNLSADLLQAATPSPGNPITMTKAQAMEQIGMMQEAYHSNLSFDIRALVESFRNKIATGAPYSGSHPILSALEQLAHDPSLVFDINKSDPQSFNLDPNLNAAITAGRAGAQKFITQMLMVLQANPTQSGFDHFVDAMDDVATHFGKYTAPALRSLKRMMDEAGQASNAYTQYVATAGATAKKTASMLKAKQKAFDNAYAYRADIWDEYWDFVYSRYQAGSAFIVQAGKGVTGRPMFTPLNNWGLQSWGQAPGNMVEMLGVNIRNPKEYMIRTPTGEIRGIPAIHVPPEVRGQWLNNSKDLYNQLVTQVGKLAFSAMSQGTGVADVDALIQRIATSTKNPIFDLVREDIARYANNPNAYGDIGSGISKFVTKRINNTIDILKDLLPAVAQRNTARGAPIPMDDLGPSVGDLKAVWDNMLVGANRAGQQSNSFSLVDFTNQYGADVASGLLVPYMYWATRQGKNMLERLMFNPLLFSYLSRAIKVIESEADRQALPQRFNESVNTGITTPGTEDENLMVNLGRFLTHTTPLGLNYLFQGFGDMDRANQGAELFAQSVADNGFPQWEGFWGGAMTATEVANSAGMPLYPIWQDAVLAANDRAGEINMAQNFGFLGQLIGHGAGAVTGDYQPFLNRFFDPYIVSRDIANKYFGESDYGQAIQAAGQAMFAGRELLPEFVAAYPNAAADWKKAYEAEMRELFLFDIINGVLPMGFASMDPKEIELAKSKDQYSNMGWSPGYYGNPTGGRVRNEMLDPDSEHHVPGLAAGMSSYQVISEGPQRESLTPSPDTWPILPTYESRDIDRGVVLGEYLDKLKAIEEKYKQADAAMIQQNPEWEGDLTNSERRDWTSQQFDAQKAEKESLDAEYPSVAGQFADKTGASLRGANPLETTIEAEQRILRQAIEENEAIKPGPYPEGGSNSDKTAWDTADKAYDAAIVASITRLMNDPESVRDTTFGRPVMSNGVMPGRPSGPQMAPPTQPTIIGDNRGKATLATETSDAPGVTQTDRPTVQPATPVVQNDSKNQWVADMTAAEQEFGLPSGMLDRLAFRESTYTPAPENGLGMMQIEDAAWSQASKALGLTNREDPQQAIRAAAWYLNWVNEQLEPGKQGDPKWIAAGYNMGVTAVNEMETLEDILNYPTYPEQRYSYANDVGTPQPAAAAAPAAPTASPTPFVGEHPLTQEFGVNPERYKSWGGHMGLDYSMPVGTPIVAQQAGTVVDTGWSPEGGTPSRPGTGGFGNWVILEYPGGYTVEYAHLSEIDVKKGDTVTPNQTVGLSGHTGVSDFPHLHFGVRLNGEYVDPNTYLDALTAGSTGPIQPVPSGTPQPSAVAAANTASNQPVTPSAAPATAAPTAAATGAGSVDWTRTPEQIVQDSKDKYKSPERVALDKSVDDAWVAAYDRIAKTYPQSANLFEEYRSVNAEEREAWRTKNPMIRALNFLVYNEEEHAQLEKDFGSGIIERWAKIPPYAGEADDARSDYYHQYPDVFLTNAWIKGRPEIYDESAFDPEKEFSYNLGADYEEAKNLFGNNIWDVVRQYYQTPKYVQGGDNTAWIAFKEANPIFDDWRKWWYAKLGPQEEKPAFQPYGRGSFSGFGEFKMGEHPTFINKVEARRQEAPQWQNPYQAGGNWQKYLGLGELQLNNPYKKK